MKHDKRLRFFVWIVLLDCIFLPSLLGAQGTKQKVDLLVTGEYVVTMDDPTTWTKPWTVKQEMNKQNDQANRIYKEPRCHEGNFGLIGILANTRAEEQAFAEGRGPDPATRDNSVTGNTEETIDLFQ